MGKNKFVTGSARKAVARPQPPHEDRRTKRSRTRQATAAGAIDESAEQSVPAHLHYFEEPDTCTESCEYGPWDD